VFVGAITADCTLVNSQFIATHDDSLEPRYNAAPRFRIAHRENSADPSFSIVTNPKP